MAGRRAEETHRRAPEARSEDGPAVPRRRPRHRLRFGDDAVSETQVRDVPFRCASAAAGRGATIRSGVAQQDAIRGWLKDGLPLTKIRTPPGVRSAWDCRGDGRVHDHRVLPNAAGVGERLLCLRLSEGKRRRLVTRRRCRSRWTVRSARSSRRPQRPLQVTARRLEKAMPSPPRVL